MLREHCRMNPVIANPQVSAATLAIFLAIGGSVLNEVACVRCYWCGPAAEQVHRSLRPPPCAQPLDTERAVECDAAHPYCAVVASTPPYAESRVCSKHLREGCYQRYCNSSRNWRTTCTCKGDLCNGEQDERVAIALQKLYNLNASATTTTTTSTTTASTTTLKLVTDKGEFHDARDVNTMWPLSSESDTATDAATDTVEILPVASELKGGGGGGEDDEDSAEGSGAALQSDARPLDTERTTLLNRRSTMPPEQEKQRNSATTIFAAILTATMTTISCLI